MLMADLAHESNEHLVEKGFLQRALIMANGMAEEAKIKMQISMMIEAAEAHSAALSNCYPPTRTPAHEQHRERARI